MPSKTIENIPKLDNLEPHQDELQQLGELAGIYMDHKVFRYVLFLYRIVKRESATIKMFLEFLFSC